MQETLEICVNQLFRPKISIMLDGFGDCTKCTYDEKNKECKGYTPINVTIYEVENGTNYRS